LAASEDTSLHYLALPMSPMDWLPWPGSAPVPNTRYRVRKLAFNFMS